MKLRPYQKDFSDSVLKAWCEHQSLLAVAPTGTGKTVVFADIIRRMHPQRSIVLAHREELIFQARRQIEDNTGLHCEIEMAEFSAEANLFKSADVIISTIQTQISGNGTKRMHRFDPMQFGCLIVDEAHHAVSPSYMSVIEHYKQNPDLRILGVTATPDRCDEEAMGKVFEHVAFDYEILDAINDGWLVPIEQQMVTIEGLDFSHIQTRCGDLAQGDLASVMEVEKTLQGYVGAAIKIIGGRRTIMFTVSVKQAEMCCNIFNRHKQGCAEWICGTTPKEERQRILRQFNGGPTQIVCNVGVLTEGVDVPATEVICMARPTKSRALYAQCCGRGTRTLPGVVDGDDLDTSAKRTAAIAASAKPSCLIIDFVGNSGKHKLMTSADILGVNYDDEVVERAVKKVKQGDIAKRMDLALVEAKEELAREKEEERRRLEEARKARVTAKVTYTSRQVNPFDVFDIQPAVERGWDRGKSLSEKQRALLRKQGIDADELPYSQGRQLINQLFHRWNNKLCTFKQAKILKSKGLPVNITMQQASQLLDCLAKNHWQRTPELEQMAATLKAA